MAGLQDLLLLRELQDRADPVRSAFSSLAQGVSQGIEEARAEQKKKRALAEQNDLILERIDKFGGNNTGSTKISKKMDLATGEWSATLQDKTASEIKSEADLARQTGVDEATAKYIDSPQSPQDLTELLNTPGIQDSIKEIQELSGVLGRINRIGGTSQEPTEEITNVIPRGGTPIESSKETPVLSENLLKTLGVDTEEGFPQESVDDIFEPSLKLKADADIWKTWKSEITKNEKTMAESYGALKGINQMLISTWKASAKEKLEKGIPPGLASKVMSGVADFFELEGYPHTKAYVGAIIEAALNASKIITGGSRIVRDIFNKIVKTYPTDTAIPEDAYAKLRQSMHSVTARTTSRAFSPQEIDFINRDFDSLWNKTDRATIPSDISIGIANYRLPDGRILYDVPITEVPVLLQDFEWVEEVR